VFPQGTKDDLILTNPEGQPSMRATSVLTTGAAMVAALLSSGLALAQPASTGDAVVDPVDTDPGRGMNFTLGAGAGAAPDYEGSDDYELVPLWNLRVANLYHPKTFVQVIGPRLRSNFLPSDHWRLGLAGQSIGRDQADAAGARDPQRQTRALRRTPAAGAWRVAHSQ
jgi:outer membrane scaffolding protein for murein synthesis (MipA/OmpV family)